MIACGGLEKNIVKCVAIDPLFRGENLSLKVVNEVLHLAFERGSAISSSIRAQTTSLSSPVAAFTGSSRRRDW